MKLDRVMAGYGRKIVIRDVSAEIMKGEIISLIGPNGGGKSTLLKSISRELNLLGGAIYLDGDSISDLSQKELARRLSIVTTERIRPEHMTCRDVVLAGRLPFTDGFGTFKSEDHKAAERALELLDLNGIADTLFTSLSDGQKQRTLIARAICQDPKYLVMDEPTSYLDIRYRMELMDVLKKLSGEGVTIVMSIHEPELALQISDRLLLVHSDGSVTISDPEEVLDSDALKELYGMTDEMYGRIRKQLGSAVTNGKEGRSSFFTNRQCEYFPCHELEPERFNCLFCYCPLYEMDDCGGTYQYTEKGIKNCVSCRFPHEKENYGKVIKKLKEKMYGDR